MNQDEEEVVTIEATKIQKEREAKKKTPVDVAKSLGKRLVRGTVLRETKRVNYKE